VQRMTTYIAPLRAVNVIATGRLPMSALTAICERIGFSKVRIYIASGNVVFDSKMTERQVSRNLETELERCAEKPVGVFVRTSTEMADILAKNPFPKSAPNHTVAIFLDTPPARAVLEGITGVNGEEVRLGGREVYVHYGAGMARSKLKIPSRTAPAGQRRCAPRQMNGGSLCHPAQPGAHPVDARDRDDASRSLRRHYRHGVFHRSKSVDLGNADPLRARPGIVDYAIDPTEPSDGLLDHRLHIRLDGHIGWHEAGELTQSLRKLFTRSRRRPAIATLAPFQRTAPQCVRRCRSFRR